MAVEPSVFVTLTVPDSFEDIMRRTAWEEESMRVSSTPLEATDAEASASL